MLMNKITKGGAALARAAQVPATKSAFKIGLPWIITAVLFCHLWTIAAVQAQVVDRKLGLISH